MEEKRREFRPKVVPRQKVVIPHFASGGLFAGMPHYASGGMQQQSGALSQGSLTGDAQQNGPAGNADPSYNNSGSAADFGWETMKPVTGGAELGQTTINGLNGMTEGQTAPNNAGTAAGIQQMSGNTPMSGAAGNFINNVFSGAGSVGQGIARDFTAQNEFQAGLAPTMQSNYQPAQQAGLGNALAGYGNFNNNQAQQAQLATALQAMSNGQGPNPATAMLANATGSNVANQAALMAGNRGAGANAGMIARQAAMAGAGTQQNSAGQAAALQAQQSANALQQQSQVLGQMGNQNISEQGVNAGIFNTAGQLQNSQNATSVSNYGMAQGLNQKTASDNAAANNKTLGGMENMFGSALSMLAMSKGGQVPDHVRHVHSIYHADGGEIEPWIASDFKGVQQKIGDWAIGDMSHNEIMARRQDADPRNGQSLPLPQEVKTVAAPDYRDGGAVGGRAKVAGDSEKNDTQPAMLSPEEIVLPRSITMAPDAPEKAKEFVEALLKKQGHGNSNHHKEFHKALKAAILSRKKKSDA